MPDTYTPSPEEIDRICQENDFSCGSGQTDTQSEFRKTFGIARTTVITLAIVIPVLFLVLVAAFVTFIMVRRRQIRARLQREVAAVNAKHHDLPDTVPAPAPQTLGFLGSMGVASNQVLQYQQQHQYGPVPVRPESPPPYDPPAGAASAVGGVGGGVRE